MNNEESGARRGEEEGCVAFEPVGLPLFVGGSLPKAIVVNKVYSY